MAKELVEEKLKIITEDTNEPKKVLHTADFHIGVNTFKESGKKSIEKLENHMNNAGIYDAIAVVGDNVNGAKSYLVSEYYKELCYIIEMLSEHGPVVISKGNHDLWNANPEIAKKFLELGKIKNVYPLDNDQIKINNMLFTGFSPRFEAYDIMNVGKKADKMNAEDFGKIYPNLRFEKGVLNILLAHDPHSFANTLMLNEFASVYEDVTAILSGHIHGGFYTTFHERLLKKLSENPKLLQNSILSSALNMLKDKGVWESPKTGFVADLCRGARFLGDQKTGDTVLLNEDDYTVIDGTGENKNKAISVVTRGFSKYPLSPFAGNPNITEILFEPSSYTDGDKIKQNEMQK